MAKYYDLTPRESRAAIHPVIYADEHGAIRDAAHILSFEQRGFGR